MKILKVLIGNDTGQLLLIDAIEHEGHLWLVPHWIEDLEEQVRYPTRIIRVPKAALQQMPAEHPADYLLDLSVPMRVLHGQDPPEASSGLVLVEGPNIRLPLEDRSLH